MTENKKRDMLDEELSGDEEIENEQGINELLEEDAISPEEAGFMMGEKDGGHFAKCEQCGAVIDTKDKAIIIEYEGNKHIFDKEECKDKWLKLHGDNQEKIY